MSTGNLYDDIGVGYPATRRTEPRIAARIWAALGDADTVVNVGAGTGSYEPPGRDVTAMEPSAVMRLQRSVGAALCIVATADNLPFPDQSFDAAMAVLSDHHWPDPIAGLREMRRVAHRVVLFNFDAEHIGEFWLTRDYLPELAALAAGHPTMTRYAEAIGARLEPVPIPWDCTDGFYHAYWRRPEQYLRHEVRHGISILLQSERRPSSGIHRGCVMTWPPAGGPPATGTSPGLPKPIWCPPPDRITGTRDIPRRSQRRTMIVEVCTYRVKAGRRSEFIQFFETQVVPAIRAHGIRVLGPLVDLENPNRFVWLRSFPPRRNVTR